MTWRRRGFSFSQREASATERASWTARGGLGRRHNARDGTLEHGRKRAGRDQAVDAALSAVRTVGLEPAGSLADALGATRRVYGAAADPALFARLNLERGARITVGGATIEFRTTLAREPDKLAADRLGPRLMMSEAALRATVCSARQPRALALPARAAAATRTIAPHSRSSRRPRKAPRCRLGRAHPRQCVAALGRNIERFTRYLTLVGLTALWSAASASPSGEALSRPPPRHDCHLEVAGATGGRVFADLSRRRMLLAAVGTAIGLTVGAMLPFAIAAAFGSVLPLPIERRCMPPNCRSR